MAGVEGRVALITGGSRGIGRAAADILAQRGAKVMCVARNEKELVATGHPYSVADLGTQGGCIQAVAEAEKKLGPVDILICNHGMGSAHEKVVWEQSADDWQRSMHINLDGPFFLSKAVMPGMIDRKYGRLVYTSSTAAQISEPAACPYNSAKAGLLGLMRSVSEDGGIYNITSNAVLPGWVRTDMAETYTRVEAEERGISIEEIWAERAATYPGRRVATPQEVAETIAFFASEESSGVSGESIRVALGGTY